tara:strand:- start:309 stop:536 length:228 start_codon:yes stop_codon:yes gene_type:complete
MSCRVNFKSLSSLIKSSEVMEFHKAKLRVKELSQALEIDSSEIIATCIILKIPATSRLSSLSIEQSKEIIDYLNK